MYSWPMSLKGKWDLDFRREWQVNWFSGWPAAIWRSTVKNKILGQKIMKYICKNQNNSISKTQTTHIGWIKTMLFQLVRHQRQGWRSSLHAQVGQPAGAQTIDSYFFFISCQLSFVFHDKDQSCKFAKNTVRTNRFSNLMFRLWSKLLCRWLASATHTWASNFPGCKRWWVIINDLWWWIMNVMTLMNIMMNMMTIILLPVHEPVTFQDLYWWMMNIMMTNNNGADPKKWTLDIFSDETSPVTTFTELFSAAVCNKQNEYHWGGASRAVPMCGTFKYHG